MPTVESFPSPLPWPLPLPFPMLQIQNSKQGGQNVDFYQLFALFLCFALFIIGINLFLALGEVSKML